MVIFDGLESTEIHAKSLHTPFETTIKLLKLITAYPVTYSHFTKYKKINISPYVVLFMRHAYLRLNMN